MSAIDLVLQLPSPWAHVSQGYSTQLTLTAFIDLFTFLWARDDCHVEHSRYRLQVAFAILLNFHLGIAPTALRQLRYQDVKVMVSIHQGELRPSISSSIKGMYLAVRSRKTNTPRISLYRQINQKTEIYVQSACCSPWILPTEYLREYGSLETFTGGQTKHRMG